MTNHHAPEWVHDFYRARRIAVKQPAAAHDLILKKLIEDVGALRGNITPPVLLIDVEPPLQAR